MAMRFHVLGPVRVTDGGEQLPLGGRQQRLLLALLLARPGQAVSTDRLVDDVWDGEPPSTARKTLQGYVHHLRRVVGDAIRTDNNGYRMDLSSAFFDAREFELAVDGIIDGNRPPAEVSDRLAAALAMWTGTPYEDVDHAIALRPEITRLTELRLSALGNRIEADIALGGGSDLIGELRSLTSDYPLRERFVGLLMRALYQAGRQTEAIRVYDRTRRHLVEQVGLEPSPELTTLHDGILRHDPALTVTVRGRHTIHAIKGYELQETVAETADGRLDRAYQTSIGRQVAVNVIEAPTANDTDFVAAFSDDASAASQLAHPHLVPISDFWREPDRAYIVSPWFEGGSLAQRSLAATAFEQVASALAYAHRQGVTHGKLSASDIVFDLDGNAYLGGFAMGRTPSRRRDHREASAEPDDFTAEIAADIAGLTTLLAQHAPESWLGNAEIRHVLDKGIAAEPDSQYLRVEDLLRDFRRALGRDVTAMAGSRVGERSDLRNPFKGLRAFQESDEADFFGRNDLIESVVEALEHVRFVTLVGSSGGGKSSLVKAGVIPALKRKAHEAGSKLLVAEMYPGSYPFEELEAALMGIATSRSDRLFDQLTADDRGLLRVAKAILPTDVGQVVLVIDQFEELFSMVTDESIRSLFIDSLLAAVDDDQSPISVVVTLRADYFNRPLDYANLARVVEDGLVPLTPLNVDGVGRAVAGPARRVGLDLEPGLISEIVADLEGQPGGLPLLQYALTEMFELREANVLTIETYNRVGGVTGALAGRAEMLFNGLDAAGQEAVRQSFLRLVTVDADRNDLRRRVRRSELTSLRVAQDELEEAIRLFGASRLLSFDRDPDTRGPTVEVAHEALLREWERLRTWIDDQREDIVNHRALVTAVDAWRSSGRDPSYLLRGGRLDEFSSWAERSAIRLTDLETSFLATSHDLRRAEEDKEAHNRRRLRRLLLITTVLATAATIFAAVALRNSRRADHQTQLTQAEALAAQSAASLPTDPELAVLLAIEALERNPDSRTATEALNNAYQRHRTVLRFGDTELTGGSLSPDGSLLAYSSHEELQVLPVTAPTESRWSWRPPVDHIIVETYFSSDGRSVVVGLWRDAGPCAWDRWIVLDAADGTVRADKSFTGLIPYFGGPAQNGPFVDLAQPMILGEGGAEDCQANPPEGRVVSVDLMTGRQDDLTVGVTRASSFRGIPSVSRSRQWLAVGGESEGRLINLDNGEELSLPVGMTALNADGSLVLAGNNPLELWSVDEPTKLREFKADFRMAWFSPTGRMVFGGTSDGRIVVFDTETGDLLFELRGHQGAIRSLQMTEDEKHIGSFADDGARVWDIGTPLLSTANRFEISSDSGGVPAIFQTTDMFVTEDHVLAKRGVCIDPDCDLAGERPPGLFDQTVVYDRRTGSEVASYDGGLLAVAPNESTVALQQTGVPVNLSDEDLAGQAAAGKYIPYGRVVMADVTTGTTITTLEGLCVWYTEGPVRSDAAIPTEECLGYPGPWRDYVHYAAFSPDGALLAMAGNTGRYAVWDIETGEAIWTRDTESGKDLDLLALHTNVSFSPDGQFLLVAQRRNIEVLEIGSFETVAEFQTDGGAPTAMEFTADGKLLVINDVRLNVHVIDTGSWERIHTLTGQQGIWFPDVAVDPTGRFAATAGLDNESRVWDLQRGEEVQRFTAIPISQGLRNVDWIDEDTVLLGNRRWAVPMTLDPETLLSAARGRLTRSFTDQECVAYGIDRCRTFKEMTTGA